MQTSNLSDAEFKTLVVRMFKELSENFNSIKKIQSETKDTWLVWLSGLMKDCKPKGH